MRDCLQVEAGGKKKVGRKGLGFVLWRRKQVMPVIPGQAGCLKVEN